MIVLRLLLVALVVSVAGLGLAWLLTGDRAHLRRIGNVLRFAIVVGFVAALVFVVERLVLR